jgi:hypothetical protein
LGGYLFEKTVLEEAWFWLFWSVGFFEAYLVYRSCGFAGFFTHWIRFDLKLFLQKTLKSQQKET